MQSNAVKYLRVTYNFEMGNDGAIEGSIHFEDSRDGAHTRENALLLGQNSARRALRRVDAGVAGRIARGSVFEQRVLDRKSVV